MKNKKSHVIQYHRVPMTLSLNGSRERIAGQRRRLRSLYSLGSASTDAENIKMDFFSVYTDVRNAYNMLRNEE